MSKKQGLSFDDFAKLSEYLAIAAVNLEAARFLCLHRLSQSNPINRLLEKLSFSTLGGITCKLKHELDKCLYEKIKIVGDLQSVAMQESEGLNQLRKIFTGKGAWDTGAFYHLVDTYLYIKQHGSMTENEILETLKKDGCIGRSGYKP